MITLYRFRIFGSAEEKGKMSYDSDIFQCEVTEEQIAPFKESLKGGRVCTTATSNSDDTKQVLAVMSLDLDAISNFYHGFHFCLDAAKNWDNYFSLEGITEDTYKEYNESARKELDSKEG